MNTFLLAVLAVCAVVLTALSLVNFIQLQWTFRETRKLIDSAQRVTEPAQRIVGHILGFVEGISFLGKKWGVPAGPRTRRR